MCVFLVYPIVVSVLLSASVERFDVSHMRDLKKGMLSLSLDTSISGNPSVIVIKQLGQALCPGARQDNFIRLMKEIKEVLVPGATQNSKVAI